MPSHWSAYSSVTTTPIALADPATMLIAASIVVALRSGIFILAISLTFAWLRVPTFYLLGTPLPFSIPAYFLIRNDTGGVFRTIV